MSPIRRAWTRASRFSTPVGATSSRGPAGVPDVSGAGLPGSVGGCVAAVRGFPGPDGSGGTVAGAWGTHGSAVRECVRAVADRLPALSLPACRPAARSLPQAARTSAHRAARPAEDVPLKSGFVDAVPGACGSRA
ncbi:hypothetical protein [Streptomyces sp. NPDC005890]|uniref:hypothetical protein n=1 Tax=Streptomyces sp. NPDC005890 TaxID=3154568 RepID=UPI0033FDE230